MLDETEFLETIGVNCHIEAIAEESFCTNLQLIAKLFGIGECGFFPWVAGSAFLGIDRHICFKLSHFFAQVIEDDLRLDGIHEHTNIDDLINVDKS